MQLLNHMLASGAFANLVRFHPVSKMLSGLTKPVGEPKSHARLQGAIFALATMLKIQLVDSSRRIFLNPLLCNPS